MDGIDIARRALELGEASVLATLLAVEGHSYRKPGASMLLFRGGRIGSISPGCLEADLLERAEALLDTGVCELVSYNLVPEEDAIWGDAIGCGGKLRILLECVGTELRERLSEAYAAVEAGGVATLVRRVGEVEGAIRYSLLTAGSGKDRFGDVAMGQMLLATTYAPKPRLFLFGAEDGTRAIAELAWRSEFRVIVGDWREPLCSPDRFPHAEVVVGTPATLVEAMAFGSGDYVVICSHNMRRDREMLELVLERGPVYVGVMGSSSRIRHLFDGLRMPPSVHAPIGLRIGADGPDEIAVSIVAELIQARSAARKQQGGAGDGLYRYLLGGGEQQSDGDAQAVLGTCSR